MKAGSLALLALVFLGGSATAVLAYRHLHPAPLPYLAQTVERMDIQSTVTTLGHITESRDMIEASVAEADIFKLHPGQRVLFDLTAVPNSGFEGTVQEIKAMPIAAFAAASAAGRNGQAVTNAPDAASSDAAPPNEPADAARAMAEPSKKRDIFSSNGEGVFYKVIFDMGDKAGRYPAGMSVTTRVVLGMAHQIPAISIAALGRTLGDNRYEVQVQDARRRIVTRQITTGLADTLSIEVKSGLMPGDKVLIREDENLYKPGYRG